MCASLSSEQTPYLRDSSSVCRWALNASSRYSSPTFAGFMPEACFGGLELDNAT
jgi:hypothetical protein